MKDTQFEAENTSEIQSHSQKYLDYIRAEEDKKAKREQQGFATMYSAAAMAGGFHEVGKPGRVVVAARTFCILFAFVVPNLLLIRLVF